MMGGGEALLPGIKMYDLATVIETIWYWHQKKSMEKEKKSSNTDSCTDGNTV